MAGAKSKGSSTAKGLASLPEAVDLAAVAPADLEKGQQRYYQLRQKKPEAFLTAVEEYKKEDKHIDRLVRLRVLVDKREDFGEENKVKELFSQYVSKVVQQQLADITENPVKGDPRASLPMVLAKAQLMQLAGAEDFEQRSAIVNYTYSFLQKGFSKDSWQTHWFDPRSETVAAEALDKTPPAVMVAEQLKELVQIYIRPHLLLEVDMQAHGAEAAAVLAGKPKPQELAWYKELLKFIDDANKPAAADSKQLEGKLLHRVGREQQQRHQQQQQAQHGRAAPEADRAGDLKRGKPADGQEQREKLEKARAEEQRLQQEADKVLEYLASEVLGDNISLEEHLRLLQQHTSLKPEQLKQDYKTRQQAVKDAKEKNADAQLLEACKSQLGVDSALDGPLMKQLEGFAADGTWLLYSDEEHEGLYKGGSKLLMFASEDAYQTHVAAKHLFGQEMQKLLASSAVFDDSPSMHSIYSMQLEQLKDRAANQIRAGMAWEQGGKANGLPRPNPWVEAFADEDPLQCYMRHARTLVTDLVVEAAPPVWSDGDKALGTLGSDRLAAAAGFALLQVQRGVMTPDIEQLSHKPAWVNIAYHTLNMLQPWQAGDLTPTHWDYLIFHYWSCSQAVCKDEWLRIVQPHEHSDAAAAAETGPSTGSSSVTFTDGLVEDNVTMISMLNEAQLLQGPLLLALQLFLQQRTQKSLQGLGKPRSQLDTAAAQQLLAQLYNDEQIHLRIFLLQALCDGWAILPAYHRFMEQLKEQWMKQQLVAVSAEGSMGDRTVSLSLGFYEQACLAAAMPPEFNTPCCMKHVSKRHQLETDGEKSYSRFDAVSLEDLLCADKQEQVPQYMADRYLIKAAQVAQAQEQQQLHLNTKVGLKAVVDKLFCPDKAELYRHLQTPAVDDNTCATGGRTRWDKARSCMLCASQLSMHRQQLSELVRKLGKELAGNSIKKPREATANMRALLVKRAAGPVWLLKYWRKLFEEQINRLQREEAALVATIREGPDAVPERGKASKGSKDAAKESVEKARIRLVQVQEQMQNAENALVQVKQHESKHQTEVSSYADLIRAYTAAEPGKVNPLKQVLSLLVNEVMNTGSDHDSSLDQLQKTMQLAYLSLFELDVLVISYVLHARKLVVTGMWSSRQVAAVVQLAAEALKRHLQNKVRDRHAEELNNWAEGGSNKASTAAKGGSKKKKKRAAAQKAGPRSTLIQRVAVSEEEDETARQQQERDADAASQQLDEHAEYAKADEQLASGHTEQDIDNADALHSLIDMSKLHVDFNSIKQQQQQRSQMSSSSSSHVWGKAAASNQPAASAATPEEGKLPAAATTKAAAASETAAAADCKPQAAIKSVEAAAPAAAAAAAPANRASSGSGASADKPADKSGKQQRRYVFSENIPVCLNCGQRNHWKEGCRAPYCSSCQQWGHRQGEFCKEACNACGRLHPGKKCLMQCRHCLKFGHRPYNCPSYRCSHCECWGHQEQDCTACSHCRQHGHSDSSCPGYCTKCRTAGHWTKGCAVRVCSACGQPGHVVGLGLCPTEQGSKPSTARRESRSSTSGASSHSAVAVVASAATGVAAGSAAAFKPGNVKLLKLNPADLESRKQQLLDLLLNRSATSKYAMQLLDNQEKTTLFSRVSPEQMDAILQHSKPTQRLEEVWQHSQRTKSGSIEGRPLQQQQAKQQQQQNSKQPQKRQQPQQQLQEQPHQQPQQAAGQRQDEKPHAVNPGDMPANIRHTFSTSLPVSLLPVDWDQATSWGELEKRLKFRTPHAKNMYHTVKQRVIQATAVWQQQQQQDQPQQQQQDGGWQQGKGWQQGDGWSQGPAAQADSKQQQQADQVGRPSNKEAGRDKQSKAAAAATADAAPASMPAVAAVSFKQTVQQHKEQCARAASSSAVDSLVAEATPSTAVAAAALPPVLAAYPNYRYEVPPEAAPSLYYQISSESMPAAAQAASAPLCTVPPVTAAQGAGQVQPQAAPEAHGAYEAVKLWTKDGALAAVRALAPAALQVRLRSTVLAAAAGPQSVPALADTLASVLMQMQEGQLQLSAEQREKLLLLGHLVRQAQDIGWQTAAAEVPAPAGKKAAVAGPPGIPIPVPAVGAVQHLPPHLLYRGRQPAAYLQPPHVLPHLQQPHHVQQQQQQALHAAVLAPAMDAEDSSSSTPALLDTEESDDEDRLLSLLTAGTQPSEEQQQQIQQPLSSREWPSIIDGQEQQRSRSGSNRPCAPAVSAAGLANETGEYNCFLNVVVQSLWACRAFKELVLALPEHQAAHPLVAALRSLFELLQSAEANWQPGFDRPVVNPTELREALDAATHFRRQEMNDANELLDTLYVCFKNAQGPSSEQGSCGVLIDSVFGLKVNESVRCSTCGMATHKIPSHWEHMLVVNSAALTVIAYQMPPGADMGSLLRALFDQEQKMCDKDVGGCGTASAPIRECEAAPAVLTLQLAWGHDISGTEIGGTLDHVQENVDILQLYTGGCHVPGTTYQLSSAVAYYGQHYMAFVYHSKSEAWVLFDDATVSTVGSWQDVTARCVKGKIQPSVLFYQHMDLQALAAGHSGSGQTAAPAAWPAAVPSHTAPQHHITPPPATAGFGLQAATTGRPYPQFAAATAGSPIPQPGLQSQGSDSNTSGRNSSNPWAAAPLTAAVPAHMASEARPQHSSQPAWDTAGQTVNGSSSSSLTENDRLSNPSQHHVWAPQHLLQQHH